MVTAPPSLFNLRRRDPGYHGADMMDSVYEFDTSFHPVRFIQANHHSRLIVQTLVFPAELRLHLKIPGHPFVIEMSVVQNKTIMRFTPKIRVGIGKNGEMIVLLFPASGLIEPVHGSFGV